LVRTVKKDEKIGAIRKYRKGKTRRGVDKTGKRVNNNGVRFREIAKRRFCLKAFFFPTERVDALYFATPSKRRLKIFQANESGDRSTSVLYVGKYRKFKGGFL